ncbi:hypothetical protein ABIB44_001788 [Hymenobacter sp. UYCo722]
MCVSLFVVEIPWSGTERKQRKQALHIRYKLNITFKPFVARTLHGRLPE